MHGRAEKSTCVFSWYHIRKKWFKIWNNYLLSLQLQFVFTFIQSSCPCNVNTENKRPKFSWRLFQTFIIQKYFDFCLWVCMLHLFLSNYEGVGLPFIGKYDRKCKGRQLSPLFPKTRRVPFSFTCSFVWYQISRQPKTKVSFFVSLMQPGKESNAALFALLFLL